MNGQNVWEITPFPDVLPPVKRSLLGRPKKKRRLLASELNKDETQVRRGGERNKCAIYKQVGHNRSTWPHALPSPEPSPNTTQPSSSNVGESMPPSVNLTQASTSNQPILSQDLIPPAPTHPPNTAIPPAPTHPPPTAIPPTATHSPTTAIPLVPTHPPTTANAPQRPPSCGRPNIRQKLQRRRGCVWKL